MTVASYPVAGERKYTLKTSAPPMPDTSPDSSSKAKQPWFEACSAILMALATLGTAWSSYETTRWGNDSSSQATAKSNCEREAMKLHLEANQYKAAHLHVFTQWLDARLDGKQANAEFYEHRFPPMMRDAFDAWMAQKPFENEKADPHPFMSKLYRVPQDAQALDLIAESGIHDAKSNASSAHAAGYLANTVLFAAVLVFAGTGARFENRLVRHGMFAFASALFLYAACRILMLPMI